MAHWPKQGALHSVYQGLSVYTVFTMATLAELKQALSHQRVSVYIVPLFVQVGRFTSELAQTRPE
jgi:hypothetical protein